MTYVEAHLETPAGRIMRWSGSASTILALHVTAAALAFLAWPHDAPKIEEQVGAITMELPSLAAESASDQQDLAEQPMFEKSAPPPSSVENLQETPPEQTQVSEVAPEPERAVEAGRAAPFTDCPQWIRTRCGQRRSVLTLIEAWAQTVAAPCCERSHPQRQLMPFIPPRKVSR